MKNLIQLLLITLVLSSSGQTIDYGEKKD